jgi:hypothetical protein
MIIVSGCPRSGTSLTMDILRKATGEENMIASKFPQKRELEITRGEDESDSDFQIRNYLFQKFKRPDRDDDYTDMNPNGFWECKFSVLGVGAEYGSRLFNYHSAKFTETLLDTGKDKICKIVSQGLMSSDVRYIDKVIYLIRHPRNVAKSHERLKRGFDVKVNGKKQNIFEGLTIHTPEMYIGVTIQACRWILENPTVPILFVNFDDLLSNPTETIDTIAEFVEFGDFEKSKTIVDPVLNRSKIQDIEHVLWEDAEFVYEQFNKQNYQEILDYFEDPTRAYRKYTDKFICTRTNDEVTNRDCQSCLSSDVVKYNKKVLANHKQIDYLKEPCMYECGKNVDTDSYKTIEESIKNHTWDNGKKIIDGKLDVIPSGNTLG